MHGKNSYRSLLLCCFFGSLWARKAGLKATGKLPKKPTPNRCSPLLMGDNGQQESGRAGVASVQLYKGEHSLRSRQPLLVVGCESIKCSCASVPATGRTSSRAAFGLHFRASADRPTAPTVRVCICKLASWRQCERPAGQAFKK